uniref:Uncharacterized protein n=1 Tax=Glossina pallidipes TaxID=7398 RepID=A0A1A9ZXY7_GLOPL
MAATDNPAILTWPANQLLSNCNFVSIIWCPNDSCGLVCLLGEWRNYCQSHQAIFNETRFIRCDNASSAKTHSDSDAAGCGERDAPSSPSARPLSLNSDAVYLEYTKTQVFCNAEVHKLKDLRKNCCSKYANIDNEICVPNTDKIHIKRRGKVLLTDHLQCVINQINDNFDAKFKAVRETDKAQLKTL